ncbi:two-component system chemotaxis response regulator CheB [Catenuloplanes nepalensis]|uniref:protein-glutamate methylesterase n=1 Tax=Catenuloplanes nepalensis TaxID=587533 RepID=A0ABT9MMU1_9ACTN|nr:chemotaxis protein CheB [Catenuloplanes nepalensis]MDP9792729.1 two-component system chemotaxis response regulator CheB [Catenuloplanes nepalensis]
MAHRDVIAIGTSAGGVEALRALVQGLPAGLPAAVLVVLHMSRDSPSALPAILRRCSALPVSAAADGERIVPGHVYVATPNRHLLLLGDRLRISNGPSENGHRPAVDPLFRSVARSAGPRAIGVVLSGSQADGASGAYDLALRGGLTVIQDPDDALHPSMPRAVSARRTPDHVATAAEMGALLAKLTTVPLPEGLDLDMDPRLDDEVAISDAEARTTDRIPGATPAGFGCPDCGGGLFEVSGAPIPHFRCRIGHAWAPESLLDEQAVATEGALWTALRALEEKAALSRRMADRVYAERYRQTADDADRAILLIRHLLDRIAGRTGQI